MIEQCNHSSSKLCASCKAKNYETDKLAELYSEKARLREIIFRACAEFSITDVHMSGSFRPRLTVDAQKRVFEILAEIDA